MIKCVREVALEASQILLNVFDEGVKEKFLKLDGSPVTEADYTISQFLSKELKKIENIPMVCEEAINTSSNNHERFWLVDPLDGTKEFIKQQDDFAINIALIEKGSPVLGCIAAPRYGEVYLAHHHGGAFLWKNNEMTRLSPLPQKEFHAVTSRSHPNAVEETIFKENKVASIQKVGASLKFCHLARGTANLYIRLDRLSGWDIAAGHILIKEAGYQIIDLDTQQEPKYNSQHTRMNPFIVASSYEEYKRIILS